MFSELGFTFEFWKTNPAGWLWVCCNKCRLLWTSQNKGYSFPKSTFGMATPFPLSNLLKKKIWTNPPKVILCHKAALVLTTSSYSSTCSWKFKYHIWFSPTQSGSVKSATPGRKKVVSFYFKIRKFICPQQNYATMHMIIVNKIVLSSNCYQKLLKSGHC